MKKPSVPVLLRPNRRAQLIGVVIWARKQLCKHNDPRSRILYRAIRLLNRQERADPSLERWHDVADGIQGAVFRPHVRTHDIFCKESQRAYRRLEAIHKRSINKPKTLKLRLKKKNQTNQPK